MDTAQRMVDSAAKAGGYTVGPVYHGTRMEFNIFYPESWFALNEKDSKPFGKTGRYFIRINNVVDNTFGQHEFPFAKSLEFDLEKGEPDAVVFFSKNMHFSPVLRVYDPSRVKLADPVTYDENGEVIPLSQRFNKNSNDIRFSLKSAASDTASGKDSPGRPELANPGQTPDARRAVRNVQTDMGTPESRTWDEVQAIADTLDPDAVSQAMSSGRELNDAETFRAIDVMNDVAAEALAANDWDHLTELARGFIRGGTELGRAMAARRDRWQTPHERMLQAIALGMAAPTGKVKKNLDKIDADIKKIKGAENLTDELKDELRKLKHLHAFWMQQHRAEIQALLDELARKNIEIADLLDRLEKLKPEEQTLANPTVQDAVTFIRTLQGRRATYRDAVYEYWISSLLSGPQTNVVNMSSNMLSGALEFFVERPLQILVNTAMGKKEGAQWGEMRYVLRGMGPGFVRAVQNAMLAYRTEQSAFQEDIKFHRKNRNNLPGLLDLGYASQHNTASISGTKGRIVRIPLRALLAMDEFSKSLFGQMEAGAQAYRMGKAKGLDGDALEQHISGQVGDLGSDAWAKALDTGMRLTFQEKMSDKAETLSKAVGDTGFAYTMPFRRTPINIFKTGIRKTPLGIMATAYNWGSLNDDAKVRRVTEGIMAMALSGGLAALLGIGGDDDDEPWLRITGSQPFKTTKPSIRDLNEREQPAQSIIINGKAYSYARLDPFATTLSSTVDVLNAVKNHKRGMDIYENLADVTSKIGAMITDKTFMRGIGDLVGAIQDPKNMTNWVTSFATSWVPNIVKSTVRAYDPSVRDAKNAGLMGTAYKATGYGAFLPTKVDLWGQPVEKAKGATAATDFLYRLLSPVGVIDTNAKPPRAKDLDRLILNYNNQNPNTTYAPAMPERDITFNKKKYDMTNDQYAEYCTVAGEATLKRLANARLNIQEPKPRDIEIIKKAIEKSREIAKYKFMRSLRKTA